MNGMDGAQASTIHITPELGFSYASVEVFCQVCMRTSCLQDLMNQPLLPWFTVLNPRCFHIDALLPVR